MVFILPEDVVVDFLRNRLTDPRARAEASRTEEFNGGGTEFQLIPTPGLSLSCIQSVTVDGSTQTKWEHYYIDFQNQKVIFYSATAGGTDNVDIQYKEGSTNWIYPDKSRKTLARTAFPRINILVVGGTAERLGQFDSDVESLIHFQCDIWTKENQVFTIDSVKYSNDKLAKYFGHKVMSTFRNNVEDLHPELYDYTALSIPRDLGYDQEMQCFHIVVEPELKGINVSEAN